MSTELGFETIGNATVTVFDQGKPILTTDPWISGSPYFGSWGHKYDIPKDQIDNIYSSNYFWISHGHPDHLDFETIKLIKGSKILIPDHFGNRIYKDLNKSGFDVLTIKSNYWMKVSPNIRIKSFADWNQDAMLLIDIAGQDLIVNINDANMRGIKENISKEILKYENRFLLKLIGSVDADMCNYYDNDGNFMLHNRLINNDNIGGKYSSWMKYLGCNYAIPFSFFHKYQREDSMHMNDYIKPLDNHFIGFNQSLGELLPAHIIWDSIKKDYKEINPNLTKDKILSPGYFGDNWSDTLDNLDKKNINNYFFRLQTIKKYIGKIHFDCGSKIHTVNISKRKSEILFEVPRNSLIKAIRYNIFDDLLIGNFMRTRLINIKSLYPYFSPYVAKYFDNGGVANSKELTQYFKYYKDLSNSNLYFKRDKIYRDLRGYIIYKMEELKIYEIARYIYRTFKY